MEKRSPTPNITTIIINEPTDVAETIMEHSKEENSAKYPKSTTQDQNKDKTVEVEVSYNDAEKMSNNNYYRRIEHGSEIGFSNYHYTTPVSFEITLEKKS